MANISSQKNQYCEKEEKKFVLTPRFDLKAHSLPKYDLIIS